MKREASTIIGAIGTAVGAVLTLLVAFGIDLSDAQQTAILGVVATVGPLIIGLITRSKVWSEDAHQADKARAIDETARAYGHEDA